MKKLIAVGFIAICVLFLTIEYRGSIYIKGNALTEIGVVHPNTSFAM